MATSNNNRDVTLTLAVGVTGAEDVKQLGTSLNGVGAAGADAEPGIAKLGVGLSTLERKVIELRSAEASARAEVVLQKAVRAEQVDTLARLRITTDAAGRSTDEYKATEQRLRLALLDSRTALREKQKTLDDSTTSTRIAVAEQTKLAQGTKSVSTESASAAGMLRQLGPIIAATFSAQQFIGAITSAESLTRSFEQIFGSTEKARLEMEWVKRTANLLGVETLDLAKSYQSLAAATRGTTLEGQATRDMFEAVTRAMSFMGKSSEETKNALNAVAQMSSKGTVAMEELRGQLGEALPGALKATADGAGITVERLVEMVSTGNVLAKDMLPALTIGLNKLYASAPPPQTVISEWARFKNVITETSIAIGNGGVSTGIAKGLTGLTTVLNYTAAGVDILGTALGEGVAALVTWDGTLTTSQDIGKKYGIAKVDEAAATDKATAALGKNTEAAQQNFRQQELLAQKATEGALAIQSRYADLAKTSELYIGQVQKEVAAREAETKVLITLAGLYGTDAEKRQVAAAAAALQATAAEKLAAAQNTQVLIANSYAIKLREVALANNDSTESTKKAIDAAEKNAAAKQTEYEKTVALANAKKLDAEVSKAQEQALKDNSARVYEYRGAVVVATEEVGRLTKAHQDGQATDQQVIDAKTKLAAATLLYRDAVKDVKDAYHQLGISTPEELDKIAAANASAWNKIKGDTSLSTEALKKAFSNYAQSAVDAFGSVDNELYLEKKAVLETEAAVAGLSITFDQNGKVAVKSQNDAAGGFDKTARAVDDVTAALQRENAAMEAGISAQEKKLDLAKRAKALDDAKRGVDPEGFAIDSTGKRITSVTTQLSPQAVYQKAIDAGASEDVAKQLAMQYGTDLTSTMGTSHTWNHTTGPSGGGMGNWRENDFNNALQAALWQATQNKTTANPAPGSQTGGTNHTYTINIPGYGSFNVASESDATTAQSIIAALARAKGNAGG